MEVLHGEIFLSSIPKAQSITSKTEYDSSVSDSIEIITFTSTYPRTISNLNKLQIAASDGFITWGTYSHNGVSSNIASVRIVVDGSYDSHGVMVYGDLNITFTNGSTITVTLKSGDDTYESPMETYSTIWS